MVIFNSKLLVYQRVSHKTTVNESEVQRYRYAEPRFFRFQRSGDLFHVSG